MSKSFLDMNQLERMQYMHRFSAQTAQKNISKQLEEYARQRELMEGIVESGGINLTDNISAVEKFFRSNNSFMKQFTHYFDKNQFNRVVDLRDSNLFYKFMDNMYKVSYQFKILIDNLTDIVDEVDNVDDFEQFKTMIKLYKEFQTIFTNYKNIFRPVSATSSRLSPLLPRINQSIQEATINGNQTRVDELKTRYQQIIELTSVLYEIRQYGDTINNLMAQFKEKAQLKGAQTTYVGYGNSIPRKYL